MSNKLKYQKHLFICNNQRPDGAPRQCCGEADGLALVDLCEHGPMVVVYPEGVFYGNVQLSDVQEIVDQHIVHGKPLERLQLKFPLAKP
jgi:(2Fe-2S) ferredoxin